MRPVEHQLQFQFLQSLGKAGQVLFDFRADIRPGGLILGGGHLEHGLHVGLLRLGLEERLDAALDRRRLVDQFLGVIAVVPEIILRHLPLDLS